jgi:ribonuclease-3
LLDELPDDLRQQVFTHASWTERRSDSYSRLAFLGDSVLGLSITAHLYPRLEAEREGVGQSASTLVNTERVLASVIEAVIGGCYLNAGYDPTAEAVVEAFMPEIEHALEHPVDFKSTLQERLAQRGEVVTYDVTAELGPPHDRTFEVLASVGERPVGTGSGRSKKHAEQEAARSALDMLYSADEDEE